MDASLVDEVTVGAGGRDRGELEIMFTSAQRLAHLGSWIMDVRSNRITWSEETHRVLGLGPDDFDGTFDGFLRHVHADDQAALQATMAEVLAGQARYSYRYRLRGTDGRERLIVGDGEAQYDVDGTALRLIGTVMDVTERERSEDRLRQGHAMLRMAMRIGRIGAWAMQLPQRTITWSEGGRMVHALEGGPAHTLDAILCRAAPECREALQHAFDACARDGVRFDVDAQLLEGAMPSIWVRLIGEAHRAADGGIVGLQGTLEDITERKLAADRARELGSRLVATLDTATDCFVTVNRNWEFTYLNREAERLLRRTRAQLLGRSLWAEFPEAVGSRFEEAYRAAVATQQTVELEEFFAPLHAWLQVKACPSPQGLAIYFRNITDARSMQDAFLHSQSQLHRLFENSLDGVLYLAADGHVIDANPSACAMLRRTRAGLLASGSATLVPAHDARLAALLEERAGTGRCGGELVLLRGDGTAFEAEISSTEYVGPDGNVYAFVVFRDVSERLQDRREILELNAELGERVRQRTIALEAANAELKAFAHSLAHDLRAPISAIDGFTAILERSLPEPLPGRCAHYLQRVRAATRKMDDYTQGLLSLARVSQQPLRMEPVNLSALAEDILLQLHERDTQRRVERSVQPGLLVAGDAALLRMALENLLGNAWKFTGRRDTARIELRAAADGPGPAVYCVADDGAGFEMAYADKLFGSFQRLHSQGEFPGTGIGLANVQRIVARHGGRIWAESAPGEGARFFFTLAPQPA